MANPTLCALSHARLLLTLLRFEFLGGLRTLPDGKAEEGSPPNYFNKRRACCFRLIEHSRRSLLDPAVCGSAEQRAPHCAPRFQLIVEEQFDRFIACRRTSCAEMANIIAASST